MKNDIYLEVWLKRVQVWVKVDTMGGVTIATRRGIYKLRIVPTKEFLIKGARCVHQAVKLNLQSTVLAEIDHDPVHF